VKAERDVCWLRSAELRGEYQAFLSSLADSLLVSVHDSLLLPLAASAHAPSADKSHATGT
jgi:hypothetical protein